MKRLFLLACLSCLVLSSVGQSVDSMKYYIYYHYDRNEFVEVVNYSQKAIAIYEKEGDLYDLAGCYNILGIAYQRMGQLDKAIDCYNRSCELMEEMGKTDPGNDVYHRSIRYTMNNIAGIYTSMGEYEHSIKMYRSCIEALGQPRDTVEFLDMATYLSNFADVYITWLESSDDNEGEIKMEETVAMAEQALDYSKRYGDLPFKLFFRMSTLAKAYFHNGRTKEAFDLANEGLMMCDSDEFLFQRTDFLLLLASFNMAQNKYKEAEDQYVEAVELSRQGHFNEYLYLALDGAYNASKRLDKGRALDFLVQTVAIKDSLFNEQQQQLIRDYEVRYDLAEKEHQLEIQEEKNKRSRFLTIALCILSVVLLGMLSVWIRLGYIRKRQNDTLTRFNKMKDKLLSVTSHDVRTSVIAQNMVLEQMYQHFDSMDKNEMRSGLLALKTSSDALKEKLTNILQWIVSELGNNKSQKLRFNLSKLVQSNIASLKVEMNAKEIELKTSIDPELECYGDPNIVSIVLQNLLSNALKFSMPKGEVVISAEDRDGMVWVSVTDHGLGISDEKLKVLMNDIVEPKQGTAGETGTGIGLMVCNRLVGANGGTIQIDNKTKGTTTVRFSIKKQDNHEE